MDKERTAENYTQPELNAKLGERAKNGSYILYQIVTRLHILIGSQMLASSDRRSFHCGRKASSVGRWLFPSAEKETLDSLACFHFLPCAPSLWCYILKGKRTVFGHRCHIPEKNLQYGCQTVCQSTYKYICVAVSIFRWFSCPAIHGCEMHIKGRHKTERGVVYTLC